jgi:hypothetical protein
MGKVRPIFATSVNTKTGLVLESDLTTAAILTLANLVLAICGDSPTNS